ncbi:MAG TPA: hypothetical protein P5572_03365 [Phycisphaerae bacterium]|nr:hypothetical protein [Phycisphaerales bacterium]HRX84039.1 hypothetical protein [Phycisphaerae bacterium]
MGAAGGMNGKIPVIAAAALIGLGGGAYLLFGRSTGPESDLASGDAARVVSGLTQMDKTALADADHDQMRRDAMAALKKAPLADVLDRMRSADLSEEERHRLQANMQQLIREDMERKVNDYYAAPEEERQAVLDAHIDEMQKFMEEMRAYREKHKDDPDFKEGGGAGGWTPPTTQERKERMESHNPDQIVRMFRYWGAMQQRAQERGISFWGGRRGGK